MGLKGGGRMAESLAERMLVYRARNRLSQGDLAKMCGISLQTVYHIENGIQEPSKLTVAKIELVIGGQENAEHRD